MSTKLARLRDAIELTYRKRDRDIQRPDDTAALAKELADEGIDACVYGDSLFPSALAQVARAPRALFYRGNPDLFADQSIGMCGSRNSSHEGLAAAAACGEEVAARGLTIVSGYARGVDTTTHLAALNNGGRTVVVLAEGIRHFKLKQSFARPHISDTQLLVVSQFAPSQRWNVGAAMTRNGVIAGLSEALVVIEAGATGGTLDAGVRALKMGRPVLALDFKSTETPAGNQLLFAQGARPVRTRQELGRILEFEVLGRTASAAPSQLPLI